MRNGVSVRKIEKELEKFCPVVEFQEGEVIYSPCQQENVAYLIQKGRVKLFHLDESGKRLTLSILGRDGLFGEMALVGTNHRESSAEAMEGCTCWKIERGELLMRAKSHPEMVLGLLQLFLKRMAEIQERLKEMVFKDLETRLARTLLHLTQKHGHLKRDRWEIDLKITHQELAELVGGTRENVTTILNRFESEELISKQRFQISITNLGGLSERASVEEANLSRN